MKSGIRPLICSAVAVNPYEEETKEKESPLELRSSLRNPEIGSSLINNLIGIIGNSCDVVGKL